MAGGPAGAFMKIIISFVLISTLALVGEASAEDVAAAAKAYARAQQAMLSGDYSGAADLFELADSLAPSAAALRSAVRARYTAGHQAVAATHAAELLRRYPDELESRRFAEQILEELGPTLGGVSLSCSSPCTVEVDQQAVGTALRREHVFFVAPGEQEITATFDGDERASRTVTAVAGERISVQLEEPPDAVLPASVSATSGDDAESDGISKYWMIGTGTVAVGLGVTATVFGMSTLDARDDIRAKVALGDREAAERAYEDAENTQLLTNLFIGGAAVAGATTIVLALVTDWSGSGHEVSVQPSRGGGSVMYLGRF